MRNGLSVPPSVFVEAGRKGAAQRWGPKRRLAIGDLTPASRRLVLALIDAARAEANAGAPPAEQNQ